MADWEKDIGMLKTDVKYIREDIGVMQKQIRDLNKTSHMGPVSYTHLTLPTIYSV